MRYSFSLVENQEIPNMLRDLAGVWVIELPETSPIYEGKMMGWQKTRFVLNEDGTCEIHNLPLSLAVPIYNLWNYDQSEHPEYTEKKISGSWKSQPHNLSGFLSTGERYKKSYAQFIIIESTYSTIEEAQVHNAYVSWFMVWKVKGTYKLRLQIPYGEPDPYDPRGIILKRVDLPRT